MRRWTCVWMVSLLVGLGRTVSAAEPVRLVDLLVVAMPEARAEAGGEERLRERARGALAAANTLFENSRVDLRVRWAGFRSVTQPVDGGLSNLLARVRDPRDGLLDEVPVWRDEAGADLVCLLTGATDDFQFYGLQGPSRDRAYGALNQQWLDGTDALALTLSFQFGCQLVREYSDSAGAFGFSHGHVFAPAGVGELGTVESMRSRRVPWFSSPDLNYLGVATGVPAGLPLAADNAETLRLTAPVVAAFRGGSAVSLPPTVSLVRTNGAGAHRVAEDVPVTFGVVANDADGGIARVDYFWEPTELTPMRGLGAGTNGTFSLTRSDLLAGAYRIRAVATDTAGVTRLAPEVLLLEVTSAVPANDLFANAQPLVGPRGLVTGRTVLATREAGDPGPAGGSVWYRWTAPSHGVLTLRRGEYRFGQFFGLYRGDSLATLTFLTNNQAGAQSWFPEVSAPVEAGVEYRIVVMNPIEPMASFQLELAHQPEIRVRLVEPVSGPAVAYGTPVPIRTEIDLADGEPITRAVLQRNASYWSELADPLAPTIVTNLPTGRNTLSVWVRDAAGRAAVSDSIEVTVLAAHEALAPNDAFGGATRLPAAVSPLVLNGSLQSATREPGEPAPGGVIQARSLWWQWTAPTNSRVEIELGFRQTPLVVSVYTGSDLASLSLVGFRTMVTDGSFIAFSAETGTNYLIAVTLPGADTPIVSGDFQLRLRFAPSPVHDRFTDPAELVGERLAVPADNTNATGQLGEIPVAAGLANRSLWWRWTAPRSGPYQLGASPPGGGPSVFLALFDAEPLVLNQPPTQIATNGPIRFVAVAGREYRFMADTIGSHPGAFTLRLEPDDGGDFFATPAPLAGSNVVVEGHSALATLEPGDAELFGLNSRRSQWWNWTAPVNGWVRLLLEESQSPFVFRAFLGPDRGGLSSLGALTNTASISSPVELSFPLLAGQTAILGRADLNAFPPGQAGGFRFRLEFHPAPTNDAFADAAEVPATPWFANLENIVATREAGEPDLGDFGYLDQVGTLWWHWTAPHTGTFWIAARFGLNRADLRVYQGETLATLVPVGKGNWLSETMLDATGGASYRFALAAQPVLGVSGIRLSISPVVSPSNDQFVDRIPLVGTNLMVLGDNTWATVEANEPLGGRSVWWSWTAPADGALELELVNPAANLGGDLFVGSTLVTLSRIDVGGPYAGGSVGYAKVKAGMNYILRIRPIYLNSDGGSSFSLRLLFHPVPEGDEFDQPIELSGREIIQTNSFVGAGDEFWEGNWSGLGFGQSLWFRWTAPESGSYCVAAASTNYSPQVVVLLGDDPDSLQLHERSAPMGKGVAFWAEAGRTYRFLVHAGWDEWWLPTPPPVFPPFEFALYPSRVVVPSPAHGETVAYGSTLALTPVVTGAASDPTSYSWSTYSGLYPGNWQFPISHPGIHPWRVAQFGTNGFMVRATIDGRLHQTAPTWVVARPANDRFTDATVLTTNQLMVGSLLSEATAEPQEAAYQTNSLWWRWTAPTTGRYWVNPQEPRFSPTFSVYRGATLASVEQLASGAGPLPFDAVAGTEYRIAVFGDPQLWPQFFIGAQPWPENDAFANRLPVLNHQIVASSAYATREPGEPIHGGESAGRSLWWTWIAEADGQLLIELSAPFDSLSLLAVYRGDSVANLTEVSVLKTTPSAAAATNAISVTAGVAYALALDGGISNQLYFVEARAKLTFRPYRANDTFAQATVLSGSAFDFTGPQALVLGATTVEPGEPDHGAASPTGSLWWTWDIPGPGRVSLALTGAPPGTALAAYRGDALASLMRIGHTNQGMLEFDLESAETLRVAVAGRDPDARFGLSFRFYPVPENDAFAQAVQLPAAGFDGTVWNYGATLEPGEPVLNSPGGQPGGASLWWSWTPDNRGAARIFAEFLGRWSSPILGVYRGSDLASLQPVETVPNSLGGINLPVSAGQRYWIKTDWASGAEGRFRLRLFYTPAHTNDAFATPADLSVPAYAYWVFDSATLEPGESRASDDAVGASLWYRWTAPANGPVRVATSNLRSRIAIFTGSSLNALTTVPATTSIGAFGTTNEFRATAGATYRFRVTATTERNTGFSLSVTGPPPAPRLAFTRMAGPASGLGFWLQDTAGRAVVFQASTNLVDWTTVGYEAAADEPSLWTDPAAVDVPYRFYRAVPWEDLLD